MKPMYIALAALIALFFLMNRKKSAEKYTKPGGSSCGCGK
jgi:hypothetical protein